MEKLIARQKILLVVAAFIVFGLNTHIKGQTTEVLLARVKAAVEKENIESALPDLNLIISREPSHEEALTQRARVFIIQKKVPEAAADSAKVLAMNPKNLFALNVRGMVRAANRDYSGALADFDEIIRLDPAFSRSYYQRARARIALNFGLSDILSDFNAFLKYNEAVSVLQEAGNYCLNKSGAPQICASYFDKIKSKQPDSYIGYLGYALAYANVHQTVADKSILKGEVVNNFRRAIALNPKDKTAPQQLGKLQLNLADYDGGVVSLTQAIALDPQSALNYALRGDCFLRKKEYDKAIADYTKALEINPKYQAVYHFRGLTYHDKNVSLSVLYKTDADKAEWEKVINDFQKAAELSNQNFEAYEKLWILTDALRQADDNKDKYSLWQAKNSKFYDSLIAADANNVCAYYFAGKDYGYDSRKGKEYYDKAVFNYDGKNGAQCSGAAAFWVGRMHTEGFGRNEREALRFYDLALERVPNMPYVADWKAKLSPSVYAPESSSGNSAGMQKLRENAQRQEAVDRLNSTYSNEIKAKSEKFNAYTKERANTLDTTPQRSAELLKLMKKEMTEIIAIANKALAEIGNEIPSGSREYFERIVKTGTERLKLLN